MLPPWTQWILFGVQVVTALAVPVLVWYAVESYRLRKVAEDQNRVLVQPLLAFDKREKGIVSSGDQWIVYRNIGRGPAYRVTFEEGKHQFPTPAGALRFSARLEMLNYIGAGQEAVSRWQFRTEEDPQGQWTDVSVHHRFHLGGIPHTWVFPVRVTYEDVMGRCYQQALDLEIVDANWIAYFSQPRLIGGRARG